MPEGFSVPALQLHKVLQGAVNRVREHQEADWETEKSKRDAYMRQLTALIPTAATGADIEAINEEIARVQGEPREKQFKPRLIKTPSYAPPKAGAGAGAGGAGGAGGQPATPPFDFREVVAAITGAPQRSGMPDVPSAQGGPPESIGALPPDFAAMTGAGPGAGAGAVPSIPPVGAGTLGGRVEPAPGRNVPEPSPLVGTLPGTPSPMSMGTATPQLPTPSSTPALPAVPPSPFMGIRERAELPYLLNEQYGMNRSGKPVGASAGKPLLTVRDLINARDKGLDIIPDPSSPTGFAIAPAAAEDLSLINRGRVDLIGAQTDLTEARKEDVSIDNARADEMVELRKKLAVLDAHRKEAKTAREIANIDFKRTMAVSRSYETAIKWYNQRDIALNQALAQLDQATGVADYIAILSTVHAIDNTAAREGEVATVRSAAPFMTRIEQAISRFQSGELLAPEMRTQFKSALTAMKESHRAAQAAVDEKYAYQTYKYMLDPKATGVGEAATPPSFVTPSGVSAAPAAGLVYTTFTKGPHKGKRGVSRDGGKTFVPETP